MKMSDGVPQLKEYEKLLNSNEFAKMEHYSDAFLARHCKHLQYYRNIWTNDPLHQWSRQWEYSYVFAQLEKRLSDGRRKHSILDAGSGVTFYPYYIASHFPNTQMEACDADANLASIYKDINRQEQRWVGFTEADIMRLPYRDESFDCVYCVSVLEHLSSQETAVQEFHRILKPDGLLILTFDVALAGGDGIALTAVRQLLETLGRQFSTGGVSNREGLEELRSSPAILTTQYCARRNAAHPFWNYSLSRLLWAVAHGYRLCQPANHNHLMTVYCASFLKNAAVYENE